MQPTRTGFVRITSCEGMGVSTDISLLSPLGRVHSIKSGWGARIEWHQAIPRFQLRVEYNLAFVYPFSRADTNVSKH
jgi:hypothetical protein